MWPHSVIEISLEVIAILFFVAIVAGFIDSIAGGGGLIALPAMLIAGVPPLMALGTNKLQSQFGAASATIAYARKGHVNLKEQMPMALLACLGGACGAVIAGYMPTHILRVIMPFMLVAIALYFAFKPNISDVDSARRISPMQFALMFVPLIGLYDGVFGPGAGSFYMLGFVGLAGYGMLKATAHTKLLNLGSNVGSFLIFAMTGAIFWKLGLAMGIGQFIGAQIGSNFAMKKGAKLIRPLLIVSCLAMASKLIYDVINS